MGLTSLTTPTSFRPSFANARQSATSASESNGPWLVPVSSSITM